jgi:hypothetical protein
MRRFLIGGSFAQGTFNRGERDVDIFAVISRKDVTWGDNWVASTTALKNMREQLLLRYPTTPIGTDVKADVIPFSQGASVNVVPAVFDQMNGNRPGYFIPDGNGDWMTTSPELHNSFIKEANVKSGEKLRHVAQVLKYWRECRSPSVPLSSFYMEMILATEGICVGVKSYAVCVTETLQLLAQRECRALQDPVGIAGNIPCVKTVAQRTNALAAARHSRDHAKDACVADYSGNVEKTWRQWDIVINGYFGR